MPVFSLDVLCKRCKKPMGESCDHVVEVEILEEDSVLTLLRGMCNNCKEDISQTF